MESPSVEERPRKQRKVARLRPQDRGPFTLDAPLGDISGLEGSQLAGHIRYCMDQGDYCAQEAHITLATQYNRTKFSSATGWDGGS